MSQYEVTFAGFGGQGVLTAGQLLAQAAIAEERQVVWIPSYGPEMRGGTAYCTVVVSNSRIGSPIINNPRCVCVFNRPSFDKFEPKVKPKGLLLINSSLIDLTSKRDDISQLLVPANELATEAGNRGATNLVMLGAFVGASEIISYDSCRTAIETKLGKKKEWLKANFSAFDKGHDLARTSREKQETV